MIIKALMAIIVVVFLLLTLAIKGDDAAFIVFALLGLAYLLDRADDKTAALENRIAILESQMIGVMVDQYGESK